MDPDQCPNADNLKGSDHEERDIVYKGEAPPKNVVRARIDPSVKFIKNMAFKDCKELEEVEFNEGLLEIGTAAFYGCESLMYIRTPSSTRIIWAHAFANCKSLKNVLFNEGLVEIGPGTFWSCLSLKNVCLPSTLKWLRNGAFYNCQKLRVVALNDGLKEVGDLAFYDCSVLRMIGVPLSVGTLKENTIPSSSVRLETERPDQVWRQVYNHVVEVANVANCESFVTLEDYDDFEIVHKTDAYERIEEEPSNDQLELERLQSENEMLRNKAAERVHFMRSFGRFNLL